MSYQRVILFWYFLDIQLSYIAYKNKSVDSIRKYTPLSKKNPQTMDGNSNHLQSAIIWHTIDFEVFSEYEQLIYMLYGWKKQTNKYITYCELTD